MSQTRVTLTLIGALAVVCLLLIGAFVLAAYLVDIFLGIGVLLLLLLAAAGWRKWQHSRIPVNEDRREQRRALLEEEERRERLRMERERHAHEIQLAAERHRQELDMRWQAFELQRHLSLSRAPYDDNGNPPIFVHQDGQYIQLPPANPPYRLVQSRAGGEQKQLAPPAESVAPVPDPVDAYTLLASGQWTPAKQALLLACGPQGLVTIAVNLAWHVALAGSTGGGKTNSLRLLLAQLVQHYEVYYISPAFAPIKANHEDWRQIEARLSGEVACDAPEIEARLQWAVETYRERQLLEREGDFSWRDRPIYVVIDEFIAVCKRYPGAADDVSELLRFARQYQVFVVVASQDFLIKNIGGDSGARDCYRTALYFGGDPTTARALLDISGTLPYEQDLGKEGLLVLRTRSAQVSQARAPFMSNRAIYELLGWPEDPILDDAPVTAAGRGSARWEAAGTTTMEPLYPRPKDPWGPERTARDTPPPGPSTGKLAPIVDALAEPAGTRPERVPQAPRSSEEKQFTLEQEMRFVRLYRANQNIRECLRAMQLGNRYYACASRLVEARKLRKV